MTTLTENKYTFCTSSFIQKVYSKSILFVYFHHDSINPWSILFVYSKYTLSRHNFGKINRPEGIQKVYMVKYTKSIQNTTSALQKKKVYFLYTTSLLQKKTVYFLYTNLNNTHVVWCFEQSSALLMQYLILLKYSFWHFISFRHACLHCFSNHY